MEESGEEEGPDLLVRSGAGGDRLIVDLVGRRGLLGFALYRRAPGPRRFPRRRLHQPDRRRQDTLRSDRRSRSRRVALKAPECAADGRCEGRSAVTSPSPSSAGRMSANPRCSTGSPARSSRSSTIRPGVTRDRREARGDASPICASRIIDTAGLEDAATGEPPGAHAGADRARARRCGLRSCSSSMRAPAHARPTAISRELLRRARPPGDRSSPTRPRAAPRRRRTRPSRSASATRSRSRPSMAKARRALYDALAPLIRRRAPAEATKPAAEDAPSASRCSSRSSAGRMSANRRWSTTFSARIAC